MEEQALQGQHKTAKGDSANSSVATDDLENNKKTTIAIVEKQCKSNSPDASDELLQKK